MKEIRGQEKSVKQLIGEKYAVDSYQREYKWKKKQLDDLTDDLLSTFDENYKEGHELSDVEEYGQYFLGPIIVSVIDGKRFIVDGQQRLTTLTLVLICLLHMLDNEQQSTLRNLIYSTKHGKKSFNLDVPDRANCLHALYKGATFDIDGKPKSVQNMVAQYGQVQENLSSSLTKKSVSLFADWLIEKVNLIEITTNTTTDAYKIFETMNDRGLRLTPVEMLKGYLLMEIRNNSDAREQSNTEWKKYIDLLMERKGGDSDFVKSWLRGRYAEKMSDFEEIGSQFHRWVRDNNTAIGLNSPTDFEKFIKEDFVFYTKIFLRLRRAAEKFGTEPGLECVYHLSQHNFTLQYPMLLAPLSPNDTETERDRKLRVVAAYLDILVHRRIGNWKTVAESTMRHIVFELIPRIRGKNAHEIATLLTEELTQNDDEGTFAPGFGLHQQNRPRIHRILARITDYLEIQSTGASNYEKYFASGKKSFQIEHIWHDDYEAVCAEEEMGFNDLSENDFSSMRDRIGGLVLLPSWLNEALGDKRYKEKVERYWSQSDNLLAKSLHQHCYEPASGNTGFRALQKTAELPFRAHAEFKKSDLEERNMLYHKIADQLWHPDRLHEAANEEAQ